MSDIYTGYKELQLTNEQLASFYSNDYSIIGEMKENEYLVLKDEDGNILEDTLYQYKNGFLRKIDYLTLGSENNEIIKPKNVNQKFAFDMMKDKDTPVKLITGKWGTGKAQPDDTLIPTPCGMKKLGEIQVGDYVFDRLGNPTKVLGVYPQGVIDSYKVIFSDGRETQCNNEHLWTYITSKGNFKTVTLQDMIDKGIKLKSGSAKFRIPLNGAVKFDEKNFKVDPYVIGAFIGDGCCLESSLSISSEDEEIPRIIAALIGANTYERSCEKNYTWIFRDKKGDRIHTKDIFGELPEIINYSYDKTIPVDYLTGSINQRLSLLQGLLDTDGSIDGRKGRVRFASTSYKLIAQVQSLCHSLGYIATILEDGRKDKYTNKCYSIQISCPYYEKKKLFRLSRKKNVAEELTAGDKIYGKNITITGIEPMGKTSMRCIYVDNPEHLYLTNDYIVTHNTMILCAAAIEAIEKGRFDKIVWVRNNVQVKDTDALGALPGLN